MFIALTTNQANQPATGLTHGLDQSSHHPGDQIDHPGRRAADRLCVPHLVRTQADRPVPAAHRPEPGVEVRPGPSDRRRAQDDLQGRDRPELHGQDPVRVGTGPGDRARAVDLRRHSGGPAHHTCSARKSRWWWPTSTSASCGCWRWRASAPTASSWAAGPATTSTRSSARCAPARRCSPTNCRWASCSSRVLLVYGTLNLNVSLVRRHSRSRGISGPGCCWRSRSSSSPCWPKPAAKPFDFPETENELVAGFQTEYGSIKFALYYMTEYLHILGASGVAVTLFFGGWRGPFVEQVPDPRAVLLRRQGARDGVPVHLGERQRAPAAVRPAACGSAGRSCSRCR